MNDKIEYVADTRLEVQRAVRGNDPITVAIEYGKVVVGGYVLHPDDWEALKEAGDTAFRDGNFSAYQPQPPEPKLRPYTPVEAAAHLGRQFMDTRFSRLEHQPRVVHSVCAHGIHDGRSLSFLDFSACHWSDDGTPCGVVE